MKKSKFSILLTTLLVVTLLATCLVACGEDKHQHDYKKATNGSTFSMTCECGDTLDGYRIQFVYAEDNSQADAGIEVSWIDENGDQYSATTNALGYVEATHLKLDSYKLSINEDSLPSINGVQCLFNSNNFKTQQNGVGLTIPLFGVHKPSNADDPFITGRLTNDTSDRYAINLDKYYIATLNSASDEIWYDLQHGGVGKYTIDATMAGDLNLSIEKYSASSAYIPSSPDQNVDKSENQKLTYIVKAPYANSTSTFRIKVSNASSYPVSIPFTVSITYHAPNTSIDETLVKPTHFDTESTIYTYTVSGDRLVDENGQEIVVTRETASLKPVDGTPKCQDVTGTVLKDATSNQVENMQIGQDGYYYTADNKLVYAKIDAESIFQDATLATHLELSMGQSRIYSVTEYNEYGYYTRRDNYFGFVQAYNSLTNSDGVYPLTDEMYAFLQTVAQKQHSDVSSLLCVYQINKFAQGDGSEANPYTLELNNNSLGKYNVSIVANGKVYVTLNGTMDVTLGFNSDVKATVNSIAYQDSLSVNGSETVVFESVSGEAVDFVLEIAKNGNQYYLSLGSNDVSSIPDRQPYFEFVAPEAGSYNITSTSADVIVVVSPTEEVEHADAVTLIGTHSITLEEGESLFVFVSTELDVATDFSIEIEKTPENE